MRRILWPAAVALAVGACGGPEPAGEPQESAPPAADTVFDPLVDTLDRARSVQQTIDDQAAEQRRRIEEAEGER